MPPNPAPRLPPGLRVRPDAVTPPSAHPRAPIDTPLTQPDVAECPTTTSNSPAPQNGIPPRQRARVALASSPSPVAREPGSPAASPSREADAQPSHRAVASDPMPTSPIQDPTTAAVIVAPASDPAPPSDKPAVLAIDHVLGSEDEFTTLQLPFPTVDALDRPIWLAKPIEIRKAFRRLSLEVHPDKLLDRPDAKDAFLKLKTAMKVLLDDNQRARCVVSWVTQQRAQGRTFFPATVDPNDAEAVEAWKEQRRRNRKVLQKQEWESHAATVSSQMDLFRTKQKRKRQRQEEAVRMRAEIARKLDAPDEEDEDHTDSNDDSDEEEEKLRRRREKILSQQQKRKRARYI